MTKTKKRRDVGTKYTIIIFFNPEDGVYPVKYTQWINDYTIDKGMVKRFVNKKYPDAVYGNLYNRETKKYIKRITF